MGYRAIFIHENGTSEQIAAGDDKGEVWEKADLAIRGVHRMIAAGCDESGNDVYVLEMRRLDEAMLVFIADDNLLIEQLDWHRMKKAVLLRQRKKNNIKSA
jgi:hypothetical protein